MINGEVWLRNAEVTPANPAFPAVLRPPGAQTPGSLRLARGSKDLTAFNLLNTRRAPLIQVNVVAPNVLLRVAGFRHTSAFSPFEVTSLGPLGRVSSSKPSIATVLARVA